MSDSTFSFRDPVGMVYERDGTYYRQVSSVGELDFNQFLQSGLAEKLIAQKKVNGFQKIFTEPGKTLLQLDRIPFLTYPYEWCFEQLQDAALLTLDIALTALDHGMILKDASAFNIAWRDNVPIFLDHGSFTAYHENEPWQAYLQFVNHFLGPLLLMKYKGSACLGLFQVDLGGIPLELTHKLLPKRSWFSLAAALHVHLHAWMQRRHSDSHLPETASAKAALNKPKLIRFLTELRQDVAALKLPYAKTEWGEYYTDTNYSENAFEFKQNVVENFCRDKSLQMVIDFGANTGIFSKLAAKHAENVVAADVDHIAISKLYRSQRGKKSNILPVHQDLNNPTPGLGLFNCERRSFFERAHGDLALGLALIHHLRIGSNWTIPQIVRLFANTAPAAIVEFVPHEDSQVQRLLRSRPDICTDWTVDNVVAAFEKNFARVQIVPIPDSGRILLLLQGIQND